jgi:hypothetical protein
LYEEEYEFWFDDELSRYDFTNEDKSEKCRAESEGE